ncbi:MAG: tRNA (adenosine(37)-N6)-threonylcarbamoyltransferase complex dimerization subunit type 1 TsaB [Actinomycetota bacterium]|nr:tRNA (adenosine(37)-N6)-threonylcarbamoyltransferase complex dimerization subunit type 1 TsaB [Actinomycetota bacterium]
MIVLGIDTATPATAVALLDTGAPGGGSEGRHDPEPGERPGHTAQLLSLAHEQLAAAGLRFAHVDRIAVGLGPGGFTGLRIGVATARALAQAAEAEIVGVSSLRALAAGATATKRSGVLAVIDARRGEVYAAAFRDGEQVLAPVAVAPAQIGAVAGSGWLAVGDGALRFRTELEGAGCLVPPDGSPQHRVSAGAICRLSLEVRKGPPLELIVPDYLRPPDAVKTRP